MIVTTVDEQHRVRVPEALQDALAPGQRVAVSVDAHGRMVVTPVEHIQVVLRETFGLWSDRVEPPP